MEYIDYHDYTDDKVWYKSKQINVAIILFPSKVIIIACPNIT